jgi:hypothetical protein
LSHPVVHRRYPPGLLVVIVVSSLAGRRRSFLMDAAALAATFHPALQIFDAFPMPPMPPAPQDVQACAATVRRVIAFAHTHPVARVCLAPEGRDSGDGSLIAPPSGAGRFILQLCRAGMTILPTGVCNEGGAWYVRFGPTCTLAAPGGLSADERDEWASRRVMGAIADLLPSRLRGAYQASL